MMVEVQMTHRCVYCGGEVVEVSAPLYDDDAAWSALAPHHADNCEWVLTRGHRLDGDGLPWWRDCADTIPAPPPVHDGEPVP